MVLGTPRLPLCGVTFLRRFYMVEFDIYRTAQKLVDELGTDALTEAAMRIHASMREGDVDAVERWECVMRTVKIFLSSNYVAAD